MLYYPKIYGNEATVPATVTIVHKIVLIKAPNQMFPVFLYNTLEMIVAQINVGMIGNNTM